MLKCIHKLVCNDICFIYYANVSFCRLKFRPFGLDQSSRSFLDGQDSCIILLLIFSFYLKEFNSVEQLRTSSRQGTLDPRNGVI